MDNEIQQIIIRVLRKTQDEDEMRIFMHWCNASQENKELYFQLKHLYELRRDGLMPDDIEITASWERLWKKVQAVGIKTSDVSTTTLLNRSHGLRRLLGVAAIVLFVIAIGTHFYLKQSRAIEWVVIITDPKSDLQTVLLPDGSSVMLNASSVFRYPKRFNPREREVFLDGEAYFDVADDTRRTFIVHTEKQRVNVLGTEFNVLAYASDPYTITTLISGDVHLEIYNNEDSLKSEIAMKPNQQVFFDKDLQETTIREVDPQEVTSWLNGVYSFKDTPLEHIARRLEKVHGVSFIIPREELRKEQYTGKFFANQTLEEVAEVLNFKGQYQIERDEDALYIRMK